MRRLVLAIAAAVVTLCGQANAAVYTFTPTAIGPSPLPFVYTPQEATVTLTISDKAVQSGSFTYDYRYQYVMSGNPPQITPMFVATGDVQDLVYVREYGSGFTGGSGPGAMPGEVFSVNIQFTPTGEISTGQIYSSTDTYGIDISGNGGLFSGTFYIGNLPSDTVAGQFAAASVSEPATLSLVLASLAFISLRRRETNATVSKAK